MSHFIVLAGLELLAHLGLNLYMTGQTVGGLQQIFFSRKNVKMFTNAFVG